MNVISTQTWERDCGMCGCSTCTNDNAMHCFKWILAINNLTWRSTYVKSMWSMVHCLFILQHYKCSNMLSHIEHSNWLINSSTVILGLLWLLRFPLCYITTLYIEDQWDFFMGHGLIYMAWLYRNCLWMSLWADMYHVSWLMHLHHLSVTSIYKLSFLGFRLCTINNDT